MAITGFDSLALSLVGIPLLRRTKDLLLQFGFLLYVLSDILINLAMKLNYGPAVPEFVPFLYAMVSKFSLDMRNASVVVKVAK